MNLHTDLKQHLGDLQLDIAYTENEAKGLRYLDLGDESTLDYKFLFYLNEAVECLKKARQHLDQALEEQTLKE